MAATQPLPGDALGRFFQYQVSQIADLAGFEALVNDICMKNHLLKHLQGTVPGFTREAKFRGCRCHRMSLEWGVSLKIRSVFFPFGQSYVGSSFWNGAL